MDVEKKEEIIESFVQTGKEKKISDLVWRKFSIAQRRRNRAFTQFRNRTLIQVIDDSSAIINNYQLKPDWKEDWQANISDSSTHAKFVAILAQMVSMNFRGIYTPHNAADFEARIVADILNDLNKYVDTVERNGKIDTMFMFMRALREPIVIGWEGYRNDKLVKGIDSRFINPQEFYPQYVNKFGIKAQGHCFLRQILEEEEFHLLFDDDFPLAKKVQTAGNIRSEETPLFEISPDIEDNYIEVIRYFDKVDNQYHIRANGILLTPLGTKLSDIRPEGEKDLELGFYVGGYEPFGDDFFYYRPFPDILKDNHEAIGFMFNAMFDQTLINVMRPLLSGGINELVDDYFGPGKVVQVADVTQMKWLENNTLDLTAFRVLQELQNRNTFASIDPTSQGKVSLSSPTATEIERVQENARKMFVLFQTVIEDAINMKYYLRGFALKNKYVDNPDFKQFILQNTGLPNGRTGTKVVRLLNKVNRSTDKLGFSPELAQENKKISEESGIIEITKNKIKNFKFRVGVTLDTPIQMSVSLRKAFLDRFTTKAYTMPQIFDPMVVKRIDVENNKDVIGEYADELLREKEMQQPNPLEDMMGGNNNPAMPNLKKMLNNETII